MKYRIQLIPTSRRQRPGYAMKPESLTVHNTANPNADAGNHADWLCGSNTSASAHIFVDDIEAVLVIPLNEQAWHTGTGPGNKTSIGIEVCEFSDRARQDAADDNAQRLIADMLTGRAPDGFKASALDLADVRTHQSWMQYGSTGKYCPRLIIPWWAQFIAETGSLMSPVPTPKPVLTYRAVAGWAEHVEARRKVEEKAAELNVRCVVDGPLFEFHADIYKTKELERVVAAYARLHRLHGIVVEPGTHKTMGVADGIGDQSWRVAVS